MGRTKGSGCLIKRGDVYYAKWTHDGKVTLRTTKETDKRKALAKLNEFVRPYMAKTEIETFRNLQSHIETLEEDASKTPKDKAVKIIFAVDEYKKGLSQSPITDSTERAYDSKFTQLRKFLKDEGKEYLWQISKEDAEKFMARVKERCGAGTFNEYIITFNTIIGALMKRDTNIRRNPFAEITLLKKDRSRTRRELTDEEVNKLIEVASGRNADEGLLFTMAAYTGLRKIDCLNMQWSFVDFKARMIRVTPIKTKRAGTKVTIPIIDKLLKPLKAAHASRGESLFVFPRLRSVSDARISKIISTVFQKAGIVTSIKDKDGKTQVTTAFHALRHTFASHLHRSGMPLGQIREILGHTGLEMSLKYTHVNEGDLKMPDFTEKTASVCMSKEVYETVMKAAKDGESFDDCVRRVFREHAGKEAKRIKDEQKAIEGILGKTAKR